MTRSQATAVIAVSLVLVRVPPASAQAPVPERLPSVEAGSATEALQILLEANIDPGGPLRGDGALIAGLLAAQGLTFPVSSSSGAFVTRLLGTLAPDPIPVSASGSFGPLFAERGRTNGKGNLSISLGYQRNVWGTLGDSALRGYDLVSRRVYRNELPTGAAGTVDEYGADIEFTTEVLVLAANYGLTNYLDFGVSVPALQSSVDGRKRLLRTRPQHEPEEVYSQRVTGTSSGIGDVVLRLKGNVFPFPRLIPRSSHSPRAASSPAHVAVGADWRLPTGDTADLYFDCRSAPCTGATRRSVPDLGLGDSTVKLSAMGSVEIGRLSPHLNISRTWVSPYDCTRGGPPRRCRGAIFEMDALNNTQDAKDQRLSDEWTGIIGADYQVLPYRVTASFDLIARQIVRAGQFYQNRSRLIYRRDEGPEATIVSEVESRHGNATPVVAAAGAKVSVASRLILVAHVMLPLNDRGLQPRVAWVVGLERAFGK